GVSGNNITNPVIYENPSGGTLWLSYMDFNTPYRIRFRVSYDGGNSWADPGGAITGAGLLAPPASPSNPPQVVCDTHNQRAVNGAISMTGKFNHGNGSLTLASAHRVDLSGGLGSRWQAQVVYTWGLPGSFVPPTLVTSNVVGHSTWTPALDVAANGNVLVTYYDSADVNSQLRYVFHATEIDPNGQRLGEQPGGADGIWDIWTTSNAASATLGEYQGVFYHNGVFDAATVYTKNSVADIYHLQIVP